VPVVCIPLVPARRPHKQWAQNLSNRRVHACSLSLYLSIFSLYIYIYISPYRSLFLSIALSLFLSIVLSLSPPLSQTTSCTTGIRNGQHTTGTQRVHDGLTTGTRWAYARRVPAGACEAFSKTTGTSGQ